MAAKKKITESSKATAKAVKKTSVSKEPKTMEELLARSGHALKSFSRGERVEAKLLRVGKRAAYFDIGGKSEGVVSDANFSEVKSLVDTLKPGDGVTALILDPESPEGVAILSLRHAAQRKFWEAIEKAYKNDETVMAIGKNVLSHGIMATVNGYSAFIPNSQIGEKASENIEDLIDSTIETKIIDMDKSKGRIVLSERSVSEAEKIKSAQNALDAVKLGQVYKGEITTIVSFGVFVAINVDTKKANEMPIEGLVHISELSWKKIDDPNELYEVGDEVSVVALGVEKGKLALSIKKAKSDPWKDIADRYPQDAKVKGKIVRVSDFGAFVELEPGIEGLIHMTKIPPGTALKEGQEINCYVEDVHETERRVSLGIILTGAKPVGYK